MNENLVYLVFFLNVKLLLPFKLTFKFYALTNVF